MVYQIEDSCEVEPGNTNLFQIIYIMYLTNYYHIFIYNKNMYMVTKNRFPNIRSHNNLKMLTKYAKIAKLPKSSK